MPVLSASPTTRRCVDVTLTLTLTLTLDPSLLLSHAHSQVLEGPVHVLTGPELYAERADRTVIIAPEESEYQISCFTQAVAASDASDAAAVQTALVMKVTFLQSQRSRLPTVLH